MLALARRRLGAALAGPRPLDAGEGEKGPVGVEREPMRDLRLAVGVLAERCAGTRQRNTSLSQPCQ